MNIDLEKNYNHIRSGGAAFYEQKRGLIAAWGKESVQFLDGLITNDMKTLEDGAQMLGAFPNAQGRLLAVVRVLRQGDRFLFETEEATREKLFQNLFKFTYAGDFFVEDISSDHRYFELMDVSQPSPRESVCYDLKVAKGRGCFIPKTEADGFRRQLLESGSADISDDLYEVLRIENGVSKYGVDMDETTIVPELGLDGLISYNKGCYIGQEIIARIHFRGHVAKQLTGVILSGPESAHLRGMELSSPDGKNAGKITSATFSSELGKTVALAYVRFDYLPQGTLLKAGDAEAKVVGLPFI